MKAAKSFEFGTAEGSARSVPEPGHEQVLAAIPSCAIENIHSRYPSGREQLS